jgi:FkbM family methyltransferase
MDSPFLIIKEGVQYTFTDLTKCDKTKTWLKGHFHQWEPFTFKCFKLVSDNNKIAIDIGAWIGLTAIFLSTHFKHVICVEADKESVISLNSNLISSGCTNYSIINKAVYNIETSVIFGTNAFMNNSRLNDSMSQIKSNITNTSDYHIDTILLKSIIKDQDITNIGLIKVDIEGGEEYILSDLLLLIKEYKIPLLLSFHITWWKDKNIMRFSHLLNNMQCISDDNSLVTDITTHLIRNPFATLFFNTA